MTYFLDKPVERAFARNVYEYFEQEYIQEFGVDWDQFRPKGNSLHMKTTLNATTSSSTTVPDNANVFNEDETQNIMRMKSLVKTTTSLIKDYGPRHVIAGGCFVSYFHNQTPRDVDVFILDCSGDENYFEFISESGVIDTNIYEISKVSKYMNNPNVINVILDKESTIQYIFTKYKTRKDVIREFDYVHCCASYHDGKLHIGRAIYDAIANKKLIVNNKENLEEYREEKFLKAGFTK